jgi:hypothetical protein
MLYDAQHPGTCASQYRAVWHKAIPLRHVQRTDSEGSGAWECSCQSRGSTGAPQEQCFFRSPTASFCLHSLPLLPRSGGGPAAVRRWHAAAQTASKTPVTQIVGMHLQPLLSPNFLDPSTAC